MDFEENTVETGSVGAADDAQLEPMEEEVRDTSESLESVMEEGADAQPEDSGDEQQESQGTSEPGWMRKRIDKAVSKAVAETEQRLRAQYDAQLAPILERMRDQEARELVRQGEFKSLERAKEYLQLKQGIAPAAPEDEQPRDEKGRFTSADDKAIEMKSTMLAKQANKIKQNRGLDVMAEFNNNEETREKILSGEWDFYDVAENLEQKKVKRPRAPAPMRSPNGASGAEKSTIASMSAEQFARLEKRIDEGVVFKV
jgi:hypothetical protein